MHPVTTALLRPLVRLSLVGLDSRLAGVPKATDAPRASVDGPSPISVAVLGYGVGPGWGVTTNALSLTGQLSRALFTRLGRGVDVETFTENTTLPWLIERLRGMDLASYDAIVLSPGAYEAITLLPLGKWRTWIADAVALARSQDGDRPVVILGVPPLSSIVPASSLFGPVVREHGRQLEASLHELTDDAGVTVVALETAIDPRDIRHAAAERYRAWAETVADSLACQLTPHLPEESPPAAPDSVTRLAALVRSAFGADAAVIAGADGDQAWSDARRTVQESVPHALPLLRRAAADRPTEITEVDLGDRGAVVLPFVDASNALIGLLAVLDSRPDSLDRRLLARLGVLVRSELTEEAATTVEA
ncbi:MAG: hypothetical protein ABWZ77_04285 [Naasia sp.]